MKLNVDFDITESAEKKNALPQTRGLHVQVDPTRTWLEIKKSIDQIQKTGFNLIIIDTYINGYSHYPSKVLKERKLPSIHPFYKDESELLFQILEYATKIGLEVFAHASLLKIPADTVSNHHPISKHYHKWLMKNSDEKTFESSDGKSNFLCPANPEVRLMLGSLLHEMLIGTPFSAIIISDFSFPELQCDTNEHTCFCSNCRQTIDEELTKDLHLIPLDEPENKHYKRWIEWKHEKTEALLRTIIMRTRKTSMQTLVGLDFYSDLEILGNWLNLDLLNFVSPLVTTHENIVLSPLDTIIDSLPPDILIIPQTTDEKSVENFEQITSENPIGGLIYHKNTNILGTTDFKASLFKFEKEAFVGELNPQVAAIESLKKFSENLSEKNEVRLFLEDVIKLITMSDQKSDKKRLLTNISINIDGLLKKIDAGEINIPEGNKPELKHLSYAYRLINLQQNLDPDKFKIEDSEMLTEAPNV